MSFAPIDVHHDMVVRTAAIKAKDEAQMCPVCLWDVHPANFDKHNAVYHKDNPVTFIRPDGFDFNALDVETRVVVIQEDKEFDQHMEDAGKSFLRACRNILRIHEALRYKRPGFKEYYASKRGLSKSTAYRMLSVAEMRPDSGQILADKEALYLLAKSTTTEEARREALDRAESGEHITHPIAKEIVERHGTVHPKVIARIEVGVVRKSEWVNEALHSGHIQPGDEEDATPITDTPENVDAAIAKRSEHHRQMAINEKLAASYTPPAESEPTAPTASPFTASVEWRDGSYHAVIVMSGYKTEHAAMKAIKEVRSMLIKEQAS